MPELPEVETVRRGLEQSILGHQILKLTQNRADLRVPFPDNFATHLEGRIIQTLSRRGKYILIHLNDEQIVILHLGMSGRVTIIEDHQQYTPAKHDHLVILLKGGTQIVYNDARRFGMVMLSDEKSIDQHKSFAHMGPEPLGNHFSGTQLFENLKTKKTPIKNALLDQSVVAGLGNIYVSEALFYAGIRPDRIANSLTTKETGTLYNCIISVLNEAIKAGGSSLRDYQNTKGDMGYFQHHFAVYDRENHPCNGCSCSIEKTGGIKKIVQAGRSTFFCPQKQK